MDKFHQASKEAWNHAKDLAALDGKDISRAAGWIFRHGILTGRFTQNEWFISTGYSFPSMESLFKIAVQYPRFVKLYLESALWLADEDNPG